MNYILNFGKIVEGAYFGKNNKYVEHVEFGIPVGQPHGDVKWIIGHAGLKFRGKIRYQGYKYGSYQNDNN